MEDDAEPSCFDFSGCAPRDLRGSDRGLCRRTANRRRSRTVKPRPARQRCGRRVPGAQTAAREVVPALPYSGGAQPRWMEMIMNRLIPVSLVALLATCAAATSA